MPSGHQSNTDQPIPVWLPILFAGAGLFIMMAALDVISVDPDKIRAPRWVLLSAGFMFALCGVVLHLMPMRHERPALYMFTCSLLCTAFFSVGSWAACCATGVKGSIGPMTVTGPAANWMGRGIFGLGALLLALLTGHSWRQWWRAMRKEKIDLG